MKREYPLEARFFRTETGNEPVREWLRSLPIDDMDLAIKRMKQLNRG
jgi:hypothetical protein